MKGLFAILVLAAGVFAFYHHATPTNENWVHGKWKFHDQSGRNTDYMVFHPNGTVDLENENGKYFTCVYALPGESLSMECDVKGSKREVVFDVSRDRRTLKNLSRSSTYRKQDA